jgi:hypothetical protein
MSAAENPEPESGRPISAEAIRALTGAATPQFALQLRDRVRKLIDGIAVDDPAHIEGERQIARLELLACEGQASGHMQDHEQPLPSLTLDRDLTERGFG